MRWMTAWVYVQCNGYKIVHQKMNIPLYVVFISQNSTDTGLRHRSLSPDLIMRGWVEMILLLSETHMVLSYLWVTLVTDGRLGGYRWSVVLTSYTAVVIGKLFTNHSLCVKILGQVRNNVVHQFLDDLLVFVLQVSMDTSTAMTPNTCKIHYWF